MILRLLNNIEYKLSFSERQNVVVREQNRQQTKLRQQLLRQNNASMERSRRRQSNEERDQRHQRREEISDHLNSQLRLPLREVQVDEVFLQEVIPVNNDMVGIRPMDVLDNAILPPQIQSQLPFPEVQVDEVFL